MVKMFLVCCMWWKKWFSLCGDLVCGCQSDVRLQTKLTHCSEVISCFSKFSTEVMVKVHVVDLKCETIGPPISVRAYLNQTITEFKQLIAQVFAALYSTLPLSVVLSWICDYCCLMYVFISSLQGCLQRPCVWSLSAAIMTSGCCMFQTRPWKRKDSSGVTR